MKRLAYLTGLAGLLLLIGLVIHAGLPDIVQAFVRAGWPLLLLVPAHLIPLALDAQGWRILLRPIDPGRRATLPFLLWIAAVREAIGRLLPAASIGGEVVGIRLSRLRLQDTTAVAATVIIEVLITVVVQYLFCGLGLVLIIHSAAGAAQLWTYFGRVIALFAYPDRDVFCSSARRLVRADRSDSKAVVGYQKPASDAFGWRPVRWRNA